jgi:hypothetical protein
VHTHIRQWNFGVSQEVGRRTDSDGLCVVGLAVQWLVSEWQQVTSDHVPSKATKSGLRLELPLSMHVQHYQRMQLSVGNK